MSKTCEICFSSGFGEIAIVWQKLGQLSKVPGFQDTQYKAWLCPDDPRGCTDFIRTILSERQIAGIGTHTTKHILQNVLNPASRPASLLHGPVYPSIDYFLTRGNLIADYLPELPINYHYDIAIPEKALEEARQITGPGPYVLIHPSGLYRRSVGGLWGNVWDAEQWSDLTIRLSRGLNCPIYAIGAVRDAAMLEKMVEMAALDQKCIYVGDRLFTSLALIKHAAYMVGFPAGPTVVAGVMGVPHCMPFRRELHQHFRGTFTDPAMVQDGRAYLPFFTEAPGAVAQEILDRVPVTLKTGRSLPPPKIPGCPTMASPDWKSTLNEELKQFEHTSLEAYGKVKWADYAFHYALGRALRPTSALTLSDDGYGTVALLAGSLDVGNPLEAIGCLAYTPPVKLAERLKKLNTRTTFRTKIIATSLEDGDARIELLKLVRSPAYPLALVDLPYIDNLDLAWEMLMRPGYLVITGCDIPEVKQAVVAYAKQKGVPAQQIGRCDWLMLEK